MKLPFEDIDEECEANADQKINLKERLLIVAVSGFAKVLLWRLKKAKTYGDLYKIAKFIHRKAESVEKDIESYEETNPEIASDKLVSIVEEATEELNGHQGDGTFG